MIEFQLRDAVPQDESFVNELTRTTMCEYVKATWNSDEDREHYYDMNKFRQSATKIIQVDDIDVGRMTVTRNDKVIVLDGIHILPQSQGRGLGRQVIQGLLAEAIQKKLPVELILLRSNPVRRLYESLGFEVYHEDEERYYMRRTV